MAPLLCEQTRSFTRSSGRTELKGEVRVSAIYFQHGAKYSVLCNGQGRTCPCAENSEVLQELAEQIITEVGCTEKCRTILRLFLRVRNYHSEIFNTFHCNEISLLRRYFVFPTISFYRVHLPNSESN
jgi:hypothetical protein